MARPTRHPASYSARSGPNAAAYLPGHPATTDWRIFEAMPQAVVGTDALGVVVYWNAAAAALYGWTSEQAIGRPLLGLALSKGARHAAPGILEALARGESWVGELELQRRDGSPYRVMVTNAPLFDERGEPAGMIGMGWALAEQQRRASELAAARRAAELAEQQKADFLAMMAHELRTPLTAILGYEELLSRGLQRDQPGRQALYLERVRTSAYRLRETIDQVLGLSRILAGRDEVRAERTPVSHLVHETAALIAPDAAGKGLRLRVISAVPKDLEIVTDSGKLRQVLLNLLSNAVKFTCAGHVEVSVRTSAGGVQFEVGDTGVGFPADRAAEIFQPFRRLENAEHSVGSGLGLTIVERLVRQLEGEILVESEPGVGSRFTLRLPLSIGGSPPLPPG